MYQCNLCCYAPELCETMRNYAKLCKTIRNYAKLCETMLNYAKLCETMRNYAELWKLDAQFRANVSICTRLRIESSLPEFSSGSCRNGVVTRRSKPYVHHAPETKKTWVQNKLPRITSNADIHIHTHTKSRARHAHAGLNVELSGLK